MGKYAGAASIRFAIAPSERLYSLRDSEFHFILQKAIVRSQFFKGVMMPDLTGFEVLEELKSDRGTYQIPAIVMTSQY